MNGKKILLVEDNPNDVWVTKRMFEKSKINNEIVVLGDGEAVIKYLFEDDSCKVRNSSRDLPMLILLDLNLPKVSGVDILREIRNCQDTKLIPVIVFSSSDEEDDRITSYLLGVISFVRKPVKFNDFIEAIKLLGLFILITNQQPLEFIVK